MTNEERDIQRKLRVLHAMLAMPAGISGCVLLSVSS